jgi:hypothetical protein
MMTCKLQPCDSRAQCYLYGLMIAGSLWGLLIAAAALT